MRACYAVRRLTYKKRALARGAGGENRQTPEGPEHSRRSSWKHGHYSADAKAVRRKARLHVKALRRLIAIAERAPLPNGDRNGSVDWDQIGGG